MKKDGIYISGGITGRDWNDVKRHFLAAEENINTIWPHRTIYNPVAHSSQDSWEDYMRVSLMDLMHCSMIYMLNGWEKSRGACLERNIAFELGLTINYEKDFE